jgi:hypothetical protein
VLKYFNVFPFRLGAHVSYRNSATLVGFSGGSPMPATVALTLEQAAERVQLDPHEIIWACEQHGECSTDAYTVLPCDDDLYIVRPR